MSYFYDRIASSPKGARALSAARLRYGVLKILHRALVGVGFTQVELAKRLGVRKSAVNQVFRGDGNVRISTLAEYLHEMGLELVLQVAPLGAQRAEAVQDISRQWKMTRSVAKKVPAAIHHLAFEADAIEWHGQKSSSSTRQVGFQSYSGRAGTVSSKR